MLQPSFRIASEGELFMIKTNKIFFSLLALCFVGCTSMEVTFESEPTGANVYLNEGKIRKKIATTPQMVDLAEVQSLDSYSLLVSKPGYADHSLLLESRAIPSVGEVFVELAPLANNRDIASTDGASPHHDYELNQKIDQVSRKIASIQGQLLRKNFNQAEVLAQELVNENPNLGVGWSLLGNAYYLQSRKQEALSAYEQALQYDPENKETQLMIKKIRGGTIP